MAITQTTVIREVLGPRSEGTGYNTLIRHYGVLNMRWLLISLGFIIISWIFFVASFAFASPAQAETWSCSYIDPVKVEPKPFVFIRNGKNFDVQGSPWFGNRAFGKRKT